MGKDDIEGERVGDGKGRRGMMKGKGEMGGKKRRGEETAHMIFKKGNKFKERKTKIKR